ncbi:MAG: putative esterase [Myxococcota bacterium]|jgi:predicted esterase
MRFFVFLPLLVACSGSTTDSASPDTDTDSPDDTGPGDTAPFDPPDWCPEIGTGLQDVTTTDASPYFLTHPMTDSLDVPTVILFGGGPGNRGSAEGAFRGWLDGGDGMAEVRTVMPYAADEDLTDEYDRALAVLDEVLLCWGGDPAAVHIAGTSNGGRGAFDLMLDNPDRFATLLGAPGVFSSASSGELAGLVGRRVYNGVGSEDTSWQPSVEQTHEQLEAAGVDSIYAEFDGQGHVLTQEFDTTVFFDFWLDR